MNLKDGKFRDFLKMVLKSYLVFWVMIALVIIVAPSYEVEDFGVETGQSNVLYDFENVESFEVEFLEVSSDYIHRELEDVELAKFSLNVSEDSKGSARVKGFTLTVEGIDTKSFDNFVMTSGDLESEGKKNGNEVTFGNFNKKIWPGESIVYSIRADVSKNAQIGDRFSMVFETPYDLNFSIAGERAVGSQAYPIRSTPLSLIGDNAFYRLN